MVRVHMRLVVGLLAAVLLLGVAGCKSSKPAPLIPLTHAGTDILGGVGKFDAATDPSVWFLQAPDVATRSIAPCTGFIQNCATVTGSDLGVSDYDTQLIHWDGANVAPKYLTLSKTKKYTITVRASASVAGKTMKVALLDVNYTEIGSSTFTLATTPAYQTGDTFELASGDTADVSVRVNLGSTDNAGVTFQLDDLQIWEEDAVTQPPPPVSGTDLLAAAGSFDAAAQQGNWFMNVPSPTASTSASLTFPDCADFSGKCAVVSSPDYGDANWNTQFVYGTAGVTAGSGNLTWLTINKTKTYRIALKGRVDSPDNQSRSVAIWVQDNAYEWPPTIQYTVPLTTSAASYDSGNLTLDTSKGYSGDTGQFDFTISLGPDSSNKDVTFYFDDIQLLEN